MSGVFLSYSRTDRELAEQVVTSLRAIGVDVWWDADMPGVDWQQELDRQITELTALIVIWTPASLNSAYVRDEARLALSQQKLVNVLADGATSPPFPFDRINGLPIEAWTGREPHAGWNRLVATLEEHMVRAGSLKPRDLVDAQARRDQAVRDALAKVSMAEDAFQDGKQREADTKDASAAARQGLETAETQLQRVAEMHASTSLLRAAQADLEAARNAFDAAETERKAAAANLSSASRALTRARNELDAMFHRAGSTAPAPRAPAPDAVPAVETPAETPTPAAGSSVETVAAAPETIAEGVEAALETPAVEPPPTAESDAAEDAAAAEVPPASPPAAPAAEADTLAAASDDSGATATTVVPPPPPHKPVPVLAILGAGIGALLSLVLVVSLLGHSPPPVADTNTADANAVDANATGEANTATAGDTSNTVTAPPGGGTDSPVDVATAKANAQSAAQRNDYNSAAYWWLMAANQGDAEAQYQMGHAYALGQGVNTDLPTAVGWFQKSANQGYPDGEDWLAFEYSCGCGVDKDMGQARYWYQKAADAGSSDAQDWLKNNPA